MPNITKSKQKVIALSLSFIIVLLLFTTQVSAETISGNNIVLKSDETLEQTSFLSGNNIRIDGDIKATAFVAGNHIEINGTIDGDLFVAAQSITINGKVDGSIFTASQNVTINNHVANNIYSAGAILDVNAQTDGSVFLAGQNINLKDKAQINKDAFISGANIYQDGKINGDLTSSSTSLNIEGDIDGDLNYLSETEENELNNANIAGDINWSKIKSNSFSTLFKVFSVIFSILAALVIWLVIRLIHKTFWINLAIKIKNTPLQTLGFGTLALILTPFIAVALMLTVIGIPLSFILLIFYVISLYISKIIISVFFAFSLQKRYNWSFAKGFWLFLLSLILLSILVAIPIVGWLIRFIIAIFGLGAIVLSLKKEPEVETTNN